MDGHSAVRTIDVGADSDGQRLDNFLLRELKGVPKSRIYKLIRKGEVRVNKRRCKPDTRLVAGDQVRIPPVRTATRDAPPLPSENLAGLLAERILFETEDFAVINKPAGLPVHGGSGIHLGLIEAFRQLRPEWAAAELAHRLDRDTSGCLLIAKTAPLLKEMHEKLKTKSVLKGYMALVEGRWPKGLVEVDAPLQKNQLQSGERIVRVEKGGKAAITRFEIIEELGEGGTLLRAEPVTGRTHQIRVHCQFAGHPILGDTKYSRRGAHVPGQPTAPRLCLHSARLSFTLADGRSFDFHAPPSEYLQEQLKLLRFRQK